MDILTWNVQWLLLLRALTNHPSEQGSVPEGKVPKHSLLSWRLTPSHTLGTGGCRMQQASQGSGHCHPKVSQA